jgi:hypothetical protein
VRMPGAAGNALAHDFSKGNIDEGQTSATIGKIGDELAAIASAIVTGGAQGEIGVAQRYGSAQVQPG